MSGISNKILELISTEHLFATYEDQPKETLMVIHLYAYCYGQGGKADPIGS